jgi:steroid delta-isomerase-like uncharacterized protein
MACGQIARTEGFPMRKTNLVLLAGLALPLGCGGGEPQPITPPPPPAAPTETAAVQPAETATTPPPAPPKPALADLEKASLQTFSDGFNAHDSKKCASMYADGATVTHFGMGPDVSGKDGIADGLQHLFNEYPDAKFAPSRTFTKGSTVVIEWVMTGTNTGDFTGPMAMKATNKSVGFQGASVLTFNDDGLVSKEHIYFDMGTIMSQLGVAKAPARPIATLPASSESHVSKGTTDEDKNVAAYNAMSDAMSNHKEKDFLAFIPADSTYDDFTQAKQMKGTKDAKAWFEMMSRAVPDLKGSTANVLGVEDYTVAEIEMTGTQKGAMGPLRASNKPIDIHGLEIVQWKDGKTTHGWLYANSAELLQQIGAWKPPAGAGGGAAKP